MRSIGQRAWTFVDLELHVKRVTSSSSTRVVQVVHWLILAAWASACSGGAAAPTVRLSGEGESCLKTSDCTAVLVCVANSCTPTSSADAGGLADNSSLHGDVAADLDESEQEGGDSPELGADSPGDGSMAADLADASSAAELDGSAGTDVADVLGACSPLSCNDNNVCTVDTCSLIDSICQHAAAIAPCDDGNLCTFADTCASGACAGSAVNCSDGNSCTLDSCAMAAGCLHENGAGSCDDKDGCTKQDKCQAGKCIGLPMVAMDCDDGNACTNDACVPALGCQHLAVGGACDDGSKCTIDDSCQANICAGKSPGWTASFALSGWDLAESVASTGDGGFVLAGTTQPVVNGKSQQFSYGVLLRTDSKGKVAWQSEHGDGSGEAGLVGLVADGNGISACGYRGKAGAQVAWLLRTDSVGNVTFSKDFPGQMQTMGNSAFQAIVEGDAGGWVLAGWSADGSGFSNDARVVSIGGDGSVLWSSQFSAAGNGVAKDIIRLQTTYVVSGFKNKSGEPGQGQLWAAGVDVKGALMWEFDGTAENSEGRAVVAMDGGVVVVGSGTKSGVAGPYLVRLDSAGKKLWEAVVAMPKPWSPYAATATVGGVVLTGPSVIAKVDPTGNLLWSRPVAGTGLGVIQAAGGYVVAGSSFGSPSDMLLVRTNSEGYGTCQ